MIINIDEDLRRINELMRKTVEENQQEWRTMAGVGPMAGNDSPGKGTPNNTAHPEKTPNLPGKQSAP